ncbi:NitT/TauT family transport system permease protein [Rhodobium orientis]|uniref:ABC transporter permease n=1 Tax=Rhodobium orientis TaxID=34017 RepID=A0A327JNA8_9HYPH|nr:ABC transporter permease subunit [Rhodobium orientis]MBB4304592.1 NitT/TauT family transport system permease protein [Rhodobium orientis]MBK5951374.1 ABC transporter permease [Rhodobium orientis]RAI27551.1 ABC transporter permease [Rhodobium orientis]
MGKRGDRRGARPVLFAALGIALLLVLWQAGHLAYGSLVLPGLGETIAALWRMTLAGEVGPALAATAFHAAGGWVVGVAVGVLAGTLAGLVDDIRFTLRPVAIILLGVPAIAWIVLALLWFPGHSAVVFTVAVVTAPIVFAAAAEGARSLDGDLAKMARAYRAPPAAMALDVYAPHMLSHLFPAFTATLAMSWKVSVMAELLSGVGGIGDGLAAARARVDTAETMAWVVVLVVVLIVVDRILLQPFQRRAELWRETGTPAP